MVKIRLARFGKKKAPTYRIVVSDAQKDTHGTYIESIGTFNPTVNPKVITVDSERVKYWLSVGAQPSPSVHNLLVNQGLIEADKIRAAKFKKPEVTEEEQTEAPATEAASDSNPQADDSSPEQTEKAEEKTDEPTEEKAE